MEVSIHTLPQWPHILFLNPLCPSAHCLRGILPGPTACASPTWKAYHRLEPNACSPIHSATHPEVTSVHYSHPQPSQVSQLGREPWPCTNHVLRACTVPASCAAEPEGCRVPTGSPSGPASLLCWGCRWALQPAVVAGILTKPLGPDSPGPPPPSLLPLPTSTQPMALSL